jgi:hypothetical protein
MRKKGRKKLTQYQGIDIYFDLNDNKFKAQDNITGECFEDQYIWNVYNGIDHPVYETCEKIEGYIIDVLHADKAVSNKINKRTGKRVWIKSDGKFIDYGDIICHKDEMSEKLYNEYVILEQAYSQGWRSLSSKHEQLKAYAKQKQQETTNENKA